MEDLYKVLQVAPGVDREAIQAAYERLKKRNGGTVTADLDYAYQVLSDSQSRRTYDNARIDPRGLRALFNIEGRQEKVVWNADSRVGEEPPPPAPPPDPWGLRRETEEPFDGDIELFDPLDHDDSSTELSVSDVEPAPVDGQAAEEPPGQETFAWDEGPPLESAEADPIATIAPVPAPAGPAASVRPPAPHSAPSASSGKKKKTRAAARKSRPSTPGSNGKASAGRKKASKPKDSPRHARTAASQLLAAPPDLEAITLTTYRPEDFEQPSPPSWWNPVNLVSLFSVAIVTIAAIGGTYYLWETTRSGDEQTAPGAEQADPLDSLAAPPSIPAGDELPPEFEAVARSHVEDFVGPLGESYEFLGYTSTTLADGSYFFAVGARNEASLDGTHQRVFFFVGETAVGLDWAVDSLSVASINGLSDGRIRVVYSAYAEGDEACCGSLEPVTVFFSYDGALLSTLAEPPSQILER